MPPLITHHQAFLDELALIHQTASGSWILAGDFNLVRDPSDKNNDHFNASLATSFNACIDDLGLFELPLLDRLFTWSNMRDDPTLAHLDRVFFNSGFNNSFPNSTLTSLTWTTSDHTPLLVHITTAIPKSPIFRLESSWLHNPSFLPAVSSAWNATTPQSDAAGALAGCLKAARCAAKVWSRKHRAPPALHNDCKFLIHMFDLLEEHR